MRHSYLATLVSCTSILFGCGAPDSPEQQVRQAIGKLEAAAEHRSVSDFMDGVSENYRDANGLDRQGASNYLRGYFLTNQSIHLLTRIEDISFPTADEAHAKVKVGMVGKEGDEAWDLAADVRDFDLVLQRDGSDWKVTHARWDGS